MATTSGAVVVRLEGCGDKAAASRQGVAKVLAMSVGKIDPDNTVLIFLDGDGQHAPEEIPRFIEAVRAGADFAVGQRAFDGTMPLVRRWGNRAITAYMRWRFGTTVADPWCGFRAWRVRQLPIFLGVTLSGYVGEIEQVIAATACGLRIANVPVSTIYADEGSGLTVWEFLRLWWFLVWGSRKINRFWRVKNPSITTGGSVGRMAG